MEQGVKLKLGLALVLTQLLIYYYLPKGFQKGKQTALSEVHGDFCRVCPVEKVCLAPLSALMYLCPQPRVEFAPRIKESKNDQSADDEDDNEEDRTKVITKSQKQKKIKSQKGVKNEEEGDQDEVGKMLSTENESEPIKEENKETNLSCHIIIVLLVVSVGASLADCFQERARRKANPELVNSMGARGEPSLNRRMSLADLTMQRHARRESQASFKQPSGPISKAVAGQERFMDRRSSSQETPRGPSAQVPSRQKSCPAPFLRRLSTIDLQDARDPQELSWAERRRVRMIQRH